MKGLIALAVVLAACTHEKKADTRERPLEIRKGDSTAQMKVDSSQALLSTSYGASVQVAVDSSTYKIKYSLGTYNTGDTVVVKLTRDSSATVKPVSITRLRFAKIDSVSFRVDKIYNSVAKYSSCVRRRKNALLSEICQFWQTNFTKAPDSMWVDSSLAMVKLDIKPDTVKVYASGPSNTDPTKYKTTQQFCAFIVFKDGKVAMRAQDKLHAECPVMYAQYYSLVKRSVTPAQQAVADKVCVQWSATGGTIGAEVCPTSNLTPS
jgi:hypothetical protein